MKWWIYKTFPEEGWGKKCIKWKWCCFKSEHKPCQSMPSKNIEGARKLDRVKAYPILSHQQTEHGSVSFWWNLFKYVCMYCMCVGWLGIGEGVTHWAATRWWPCRGRPGWQAAIVHTCCSTAPGMYWAHWLLETLQHTPNIVRTQWHNFSKFLCFH